MNNGFRSPLEEKAGILLIENNISFAYEPVSVILVPGFEYGGRVVEGRGKRLVEKRPKNFPITYKPDFVGLNWIMEIKGHRRPDFDLRWKMFKHLLHTLNAPYTLLMPRNIPQLIQCVEIIKSLKNNGQDGQNKGVFQEEENLQQLLRGVSKPTVSKTATGE